MNGQRTLRISTVTETRNHPILGLICLYFFSSALKESPPEITNTKEEIYLEQMKRKLKRAALEWGDFVLQEQLKYLMYVDRSLLGDPMKDKLIDELNFKNCVRLS